MSLHLKKLLLGVLLPGIGAGIATLFLSALTFHIAYAVAPPLPEPMGEIRLSPPPSPSIAPPTPEQIKIARDTAERLAETEGKLVNARIGLSVIDAVKTEGARNGLLWLCAGIVGMAAFTSRWKPWRWIFTFCLVFFIPINSLLHAVGQLYWHDPDVIPTWAGYDEYLPLGWRMDLLRSLTLAVATSFLILVCATSKARPQLSAGAPPT